MKARRDPSKTSPRPPRANQPASDDREPTDRSKPLRRILTITTATAALIVPAASADYYGGVSNIVRQQVIRELHRYPGWSVSRMSCIVNRESGFNPRAVNWRDANGGSHGLAQINGIHSRAFRDVWHLRYTIRGGIEMAYRLWRASGYSPWNGGHRQC